MKLIHEPSLLITPFNSDRIISPVMLNNKEIGTLKLIGPNLYKPFDVNGDDVELTDNDSGFDMTTATYLVVLQYLNLKGV